jgi:dTDP-4-dehydrorhamnose reductase
MLTGKNGQVGWELQRTLAPLGDVVALGRQELDLTNPDQIRERAREIKPDLIVNAAAYTAVDKAEEEPELAFAINAVAPAVLAEEAKRVGAVMVHYSTDYVFDGTKTTPYTEEDQPNPINVYGKSKWEGERAIQAARVPHLIFRTSWVYGLRGKNFFLTILRLARERDEMRVVDDQIGAPTWSRMIAEATALILARGYPFCADRTGIYHLSAGGCTSWYGFAEKIITGVYGAGFKTRLAPIPTSAYPTLSRRPAYSVLSNGKLADQFGLVMPEWDCALGLVLESMGSGQGDYR